MNFGIQLSSGLRVDELQRQFASYFPYLRLHFFLTPETDEFNARAVPTPGTYSLKTVGLTHEAMLEIYDGMTVRQLESMMKEQFGLTAQVFRHSGTIWLETTMTDDWTLYQQNEHGRELSITPDGEGSADFDLTRGEN
ncbi:MAG: hypothetical protein EOP49_14280 [Sphingobacteriales bacterium]|nr:MAG: hypothetical protein EOP49_14280 [Sphingobacteriales bacterium]